MDVFEIGIISLYTFFEWRVWRVEKTSKAAKITEPSAAKRWIGTAADVMIC